MASSVGTPTVCSCGDAAWLLSSLASSRNHGAGATVSTTHSSNRSRPRRHGRLRSRTRDPTRWVSSEGFSHSQRKFLQVGEAPSAEQIDRVAALARAVAGQPVVIAIDGRSGSGKTTFAAALQSVLEDAVVIHLDHIYPGWDGLAATPDLVTSQILKPVRHGAIASYRRYDWARGEFGELVTVPASHFVIIEGAGSSVGPARAYVDLCVWLDADEPLRKQRALARDGDAYRPHWQRWADQEAEVFAADRTRDHAHLIVRTD